MRLHLSFGYLMGDYFFRYVHVNDIRNNVRVELLSSLLGAMRGTLTQKWGGDSNRNRIRFKEVDTLRSFPSGLEIHYFLDPDRKFENTFRENQLPLLSEFFSFANRNLLSIMTRLALGSSSALWSARENSLRALEVPQELWEELKENKPVLVKSRFSSQGVRICTDKNNYKIRVERSDWNTYVGVVSNQESERTVCVVTESQELSRLDPSTGDLSDLRASLETWNQEAEVEQIPVFAPVPFSALLQKSMCCQREIKEYLESSFTVCIDWKDQDISKSKWVLWKPSEVICFLNFFLRGCRAASLDLSSPLRVSIIRNIMDNEMNAFLENGFTSECLELPVVLQILNSCFYSLFNFPFESSLQTIMEVYFRLKTEKDLERMEMLLDTLRLLKIVQIGVLDDQVHIPLDLFAEAVENVYRDLAPPGLVDPLLCRPPEINPTEATCYLKKTSIYDIPYLEDGTIDLFLGFNEDNEVTQLPKKGVIPSLCGGMAIITNGEIRYWPQDRLPNHPVSRLQQLIKTKSQWGENELRSFLSPCFSKEDPKAIDSFISRYLLKQTAGDRSWFIKGSLPMDVKIVQ